MVPADACQSLRGAMTAPLNHGARTMPAGVEGQTLTLMTVMETVQLQGSGLETHRHKGADIAAGTPRLNAATLAALGKPGCRSG
jgi:hypothetical protein